jgi:hypothetical protein
MTSIIKVDQIQTAAGGVPTAGDLGLNTTGTVLEHIEGHCDGRTVGGVVFPTVSSYSTFASTSYADVQGSEVTYTPPSDATTVIYKFTFISTASSTSGIAHWASFIDTDEVVINRTTVASHYTTSTLHDHRITTIVLPISVGGVQDVANGKLSSWTAPKTIKLKARTYNSTGYNVQLHKNTWWNGTGAGGSDMVRIPTLSITAIR